MLVSLCILLEGLAPIPYESHLPQPEERKIKKISLLCSEEDLLRQDTQCLYVCSLSEALPLHEKYPEILFMCIRDIDHEIPDGIIAAGKGFSLNQVFCALQDTIVQIQSWEYTLQQTAFQGGTPQQLLDLSTPILGNYINISDSSFKRIANTKDMPCDDPICIAFRENGGHPKETLRKFYEEDRFGLWNSTDFYVDTTYKMSNYPIVAKIYKFHQTYFTHVAMVCNNRPPTPGLLACYQIFLDCLGLLVAKDWEHVEAFTHVYDSLLIDIVAGNLTDTGHIELRAKYVSVPAKGAFVLACIPTDASGNYSIGRIGTELNGLFARGRVWFFQGNILLLNTLDDVFFLSQLFQMQEVLQDYLSDYGLVCGVSSRFDHLSGCRVAFLQTQKVISAMNQIRESKCAMKEICISEYCFHKSDSVALFSSYYEYCALDSSPDTFLLCQESTFFRAITTLYQYDQTHKTNNLQLLRTYIRCERSLSATGQKMHMHRNNVTYRIKRIEDLIGIDLNNPDNRFRLQIAYAQFNFIKGTECLIN